MTGQRIIDISSGPESLADRVADWIVRQASGSQEKIAIALAGGSTPKLLYTRLARQPWRDKMPFDRIHWFWSDERIVPEQDARRNALMAHDALLSHINIPAQNIHMIPAAPTSPDEAADIYEKTLREFYDAHRLDSGRPLFDITLLGIGSDGHTASLFPGKTSLDVRDRWAVATDPGLAPFVPRVTLTFSALASSRSVAFLVAGQDKREIVSRVFAGEDFPAAHVRAGEPVWWFLDQAAAPD